ncbi:MAG: hypothetical protein ABIF85_04050 [Nanoarchaeota archaeon]|nr:hypothetical protein [Nanoarchaeota archaeon]MBU4301051.1 hypothetical protein [Nanoarchaeota archaeon]MBU4452279.1 hypothetical protein [Nanoarchaeota archaeon]MCG2724043.1 hypothetical protein [archaeon]
MIFLKNPNTKSRSRKAQSALEYLIVASIALLMLVPIIIEGWNSTAQLNNNINLQKARNTVSQISDAAKTVYFQGDSSAMTIYVTFPENIIFSNVSGNEIYLRMKTRDSTTDVVEFLEFNVMGNISNISGMHKIYLEALPNAVNITHKQ